MNGENSEEIIAYIQFYNEIKKVIIPSTYKGLQEKLIRMLQINPDLASSLIISYKDDENDTIMVGSNEDYLILLDQIKNKSVKIINVEKTEKAILNLKTCSINLINFKEENEENNKANNNLNFLNIVSNQHFVINKEKNKQDLKEDKKENNKIDVINNKISDDSNSLDIDDNEVVLNNIDNDLNGNSSGDDNIISPYAQKNQNMKENNIDNNINIINNINDIKNINNNNNINVNANVSLSQTHLVFNLSCGLCNQYPIIKILYYCPTCSIYICPDCEKNPVINHRHSILKIQTQQQYEDLIEKVDKKDNLSLENNNNESNFSKITNNIKDSVLKILGNNKEEMNMPQKNIIKEMSLIQIAKIQYGLEGISDQQLEEAIRKTNGDIEKAIPLLFK